MPGPEHGGGEGERRAVRRWLAWLAAAAFVGLVATGPATGASGLSVPIAWAVAVAAGVGALVAVRFGRERPVPVAAVLLVAGLAVVGVVLVGVVLVAGRDVVVDAAAAVFGPGRSVVYAAGIAGAAVAVGIGLGWRSGAPVVRAALPIMALTAFLLVDTLEVARGDALRDLRLYLMAGERFLAGGAVYRTTPLTELFADPTLYPFLYPPPTIPVVALLSALPYALVAAAWVVASVLLLVAALRAIGVRWAWLLLVLAWPPAFVGLWAGNVAVPAFALFAFAPRLPALLAGGPLLKPQMAIPGLWLVRERRWRALGVGVAAVALAVVGTLPIVGVGAWLDWWAALGAYQASQAAFPGLYAFALPHAVPYLVFVVLAVGAVAWALAGRGLDALARLGIASVVASPSLYRHGLLVALPLVLRLDAPLVWLVLGAGASYHGLWLGLALAAAGTLVPALRARDDDELHPLRPGDPDALWGGRAAQVAAPGSERWTGAPEQA